MPKLAMRDPNTGAMVPVIGGVDQATADTRFLSRSGGTVTGSVSVGTPTVDSHAATKYYADHNFPVGAVCPFGANWVPAGWLHCNGQAVSRNVYYELFAVCGTKFGVGDSSTTFNVPNCMDRVIAAPYGSYGNMDYVANVGGATDVTITRSTMPSSGTGQVNFHGGGSRTSLASASGNSWLHTGVAAYGNPQYAQTGASSCGRARIEYNGGGGSHTNVQPSLALHFMIKY